MRWYLALGAAFWVAWSGSAAAQEGLPRPAGARAPEASADAEVEVSGARLRDPVRGGASASVVTRKTLESLPGGENQPLVYVLASQPGFVTDTFGFGFHARAADGSVLYVIDGVPLLAAPLGQFGSAAGFFPTRLIQDMHVLTGGFPAEYGAGMGAVVDVTTRRGTPTPSGELQLTAGSYGLWDMAANYAQQVGDVSFFVAGNLQTTSRGIDPPSVSPILHDSMTTGNGFVRVDYRLSPHEDIDAIGSFSQTRFQIPIDPTVAPLSQAPAGAIRGVDVYGNSPPPFVPYNANPLEDERNGFAALSYHRKEGSTFLQVTPFFREAYSKLACDPAGSLGPSADPGASCSDVERDDVHLGGLVHYGWGTEKTHAWKAGLTADVAMSHVSYTSYTRNDASLAGGPDRALTLSGKDDATVVLAGAFVQDRISLGRWTVLPGFRLDLENASFASTDAAPLFLLGPSARLGLSYAVTEHTLLHAFAGYLWLPPSTIDAPVAARILMPQLAGQDIPVDLKAEKQWSGELGLTSEVLDGVHLGLTGWGRFVFDQLDRINVGNTNLVASYNFAKGRAAGVEASARGHMGRYFDAFANAGWQLAQGQGISSERYLFTPDQVADPSWVTLDHVQSWTANVGFDVHDAGGGTHLSGLVNYGSGMRTGANSDISVPPHTTLDVTLRHRFDALFHTQVALDVLNAFNDIYAYRIGTGYIGSAYGPLRRVNLRVSVPFGD